ncbi:MAG: hypothetical protein JNK64_01455 [Myxococcales bacterium]|nr:hypothetical protein [Myxococcales bacterium]
MRAVDTTAAAEAVQRAVLREMTPSQRFAIALDRSDAARQTALDGIRARHAGDDHRPAVRALVRLRHGDDLCRRAWPTLPLPEP